MKRVILFSFLIVLTLHINAQEKTVKRTNANNKTGVKEYFYVLKRDKKIKHGSFELQSLSGRTKVKGQYEHGKPSGVWTYYDYEGTVEQQYNYSSGELIYHKPNKEQPAYFQLKDGAYQKFIPDRPPLFIGGGAYMFTATGSRLKYPVQATRMGIEGTVYIEVVVTVDGKLEQEKVIRGIGGGCDQEALRMIKLVPDTWLPALKDGQPVDSKFELEIRFKLR